MMNTQIICLGYKETLVKKCLEKKIEVISLIDEFDEPEFFPAASNNEKRIFTKNNVNDLFLVSTLLENGFNSINAVISPFEFTLFNAGVLTSFFGCGGLDMRASLLFRNKILQKKAVHKIVNTPKIWQITEKEDISVADFPLVVKPSDGTGTTLTIKVYSHAELENAIKKIKKEGQEFTNIIIEEFISGKEFYVDGWILEGKVQVFTISKYVENLLKIKDGKVVQGINLIYKQNEDLYSEIETLLNSILPTLGMNDGVFHLEFFLTENNEIYFGECAARLGGVMPEAVFLYHFGIDILSIWIDLCFGKKAYVEGSNNKLIKNHTGFTYIPTPKNNTSIILPDKDTFKKKYDFILDVEYDWFPGQILPNDSQSTAYRLGKIFVKGNSESDVKNNLDKAIKYFEEVNE